MRLHSGVPIACVIALACAGCGSVSDAGVIRDWARALTAGDLDRAASYFSLPAIVENGTPPVRITSRAQAREFNKLLPCGARLLSTARHGPYTFATFRLTDRVGGDCASGIGAVAATAFLIRDGKIAQWRRLANPGQPTPRTPAPAPGRAPVV
jgi:ketosteroid isomerase-like protein